MSRKKTKVTRYSDEEINKAQENIKNIPPLVLPFIEDKKDSKCPFEGKNANKDSNN
jgi:hypothetical protein